MKKGSFTEALKSDRDPSLRGRFASEIPTAMKGKKETDNYRIDNFFGQIWNLGGFSPAELNYLVRHFLPVVDEKITAENAARIEKLYNGLIRLNPDLSCLSALDAKRQADVLRGLASGLHVNDIRYFVEDLKGFGGNRSVYDRALNDKALHLYYQKEGTRTQIKGVGDAVTFILSNETARRIIENRPYPSKTSKKS